MIAASTQDRKDILDAIIAGAKDYKNSLVGKRFLYYFEGQYIEVEYRIENYLHLTGVATRLFARDFFQKATTSDKTKALKLFHIGFDKNHPYDFCLRKAFHFESLHRLSNSALIMLVDVHTDTADFDFALTDTSYSMCVGLDTNNTSGIYVPYSLRDEDCFNRSKNQFEVSYIFCNENNSQLYNKIMYSDGKVELRNLPKVVLNKLDMKVLAND